MKRERTELRGLQQRLETRKSVIVLQRVTRGVAGRRRSKEIKKQRQTARETKAAILIQTLTRSRIARKAVDEQRKRRQARVEDARRLASIKFQALRRGQVARRLFNQLKVEQDARRQALRATEQRQKASVTIQRVARGNAARRRSSELKRERERGQKARVEKEDAERNKRARSPESEVHDQEMGGAKRGGLSSLFRLFAASATPTFQWKGGQQKRNAGEKAEESRRLASIKIQALRRGQ
eukprot:1727615-Rhodomonas_salina.1